MFIKKLRLKNGYKRFNDLTIDLGDNPARIVALVGPNGCGKSSVLDGMLYHHNAHHMIGTGSVKDHNYHSMEGNTSYDYRNVEILFTDGPYNDVREHLAKAGKHTTIFSFRSPYRYNTTLKINETKATSEIRMNSYGAADAASLDAKMEDNYRRLHAAVNTYRDTNDVKPSEALAKIIGELNSSISNCLDLEISNVGNVEASKGTLYFKKPDHPKEFEFNVLSSGEKEVIDLLLDLYLRKADYDQSIFLIDEPELHINTSIQGKLLTEIEKLVGVNCQIWITTHSIGFLRAIQTQLKDKCQIIQFRSEYDLASKPYTLSPMKITPASWRELFTVALDDLSELVSPKIIIYCEGRDYPGQNAAEKGLDAQVFNSVFAEAQPETLFVSSGGNTELDQRSAIAIAILGKVFPTVDIWVLKDRDMASGKPTTEQDRQDYLGKNPKNHRVLKRWELENYLFDKEVLKAYCADQQLTFDEAAYDAFVTDIVNQNVKDETGRMKGFCNLKQSINAEKWKILLASYINPSMGVYKELEDCVFNRL